MKKLYCIIILLFFLLSCTNAYDVEAYKSASAIDKDLQELLRNRFTLIEFADVNLFLEWNTYDNEIINKSPYKLFIKVEAKNKNFRSIAIQDVIITSSLGKKYSFLHSVSFPVRLASDGGSKNKTYLFEPAFYFDFYRKEEVTTEISISIELQTKTIDKIVKHKWLPIRVKNFAPIV